MIVFKIGDEDFTRSVNSYKTGYQILSSEKSGRNARGTNVIDVVARKTKLSVNFAKMNADEMKRFLSAIEPYVVNVSYWDAKSDGLQTINIYTGTPEITALRMGTEATKRMYDDFTLSFIEM